MYADDPKNPVAIKCLIQTIQNLYSDKSAHESLDWVTEWELLDQYIDLVPNDSWAAYRKKANLANWLAYTVYEWPSGVLYGNDGASVEQCQEILDAVEELGKLDDNSEYNGLRQDVKNKTLLYRERLQSSESSED